MKRMKGKNEVPAGDRGTKKKRWESGLKRTRPRMALGEVAKGRAEVCTERGDEFMAEKGGRGG